jgi:hypothetical protein
VIGFGIGVGDAAIATGATLLFVTNLTAILVVSVLFFWVLGFERVNERDLEAAALETAPPTAFLHRVLEALRAVFGSRYSRAIRVGLPLVLAAMVFVPLSRGLEQVAWEVRTRAAVSRIIGQALQPERAVQSQIQVSRGAISSHLFLVGSPEEADRLERELVTSIAAATGVVPSVRVVAVPDADALRRATGTPETAAPAPLDFQGLRQRLSAAVQETWPHELSPLVAWRLEVPDSSAPWVHVDHLGTPLGDTAEALLARAISQRVGASITVRTRAYPATPVTADLDGGADWLPYFNEMLELARANERLHFCVAIPTAEERPTGQEVTASAVRAAAAAEPSGRISVDSTGNEWSVRYSRLSCSRADSATVEAGTLPAPEG